MAFTVDGSTGLTFPNSTTQASGAVSGLVFISSQTVSSAVASVDFTSGISSTYDDYQIVFTALSSSASGVLQFRLRQSGAFGTTYANSGFSSQNGGVVGSQMSSNTTIMGGVWASSPTSTTIWNGQLYLANVNSTGASGPALTGMYYGTNSSATAAMSTTQFGGVTLTAAAVTGVQLFFSSGNVTGGTIRLYGIAKS